MRPGNVGLYDPMNERDSCGVGLALNIDGTKSHRIVEYGLRILDNMEHRGAENADGKTGDGTGITVQIPHSFFLSMGIHVPEIGRYGVGNIFLPKKRTERDTCLSVIREECERYGVYTILCRDMPVDHTAQGPMAKRNEPYIVQLFLTSYDSQEILERKLYSIRQRATNRIASSEMKGKDDFYICSLSTRTITYKGMLTPKQIGQYYLDLSDPEFESAIAMVHSRFSTNTFPMW